ncbi:MAG: geranylgeranylglycerol-phosphate geranylgeranyltransferase [Chitinophagaceae bacterium]
MFEYCIIHPLFEEAKITSNIHGIYFFFMLFSYVFIAAAGYIINDYFDLNIDHINKPTKVVVARIISRRWALVWHIVLSSIAILLSFYIDMNAENTPIAGVSAIACVILLFLYSASLKKKFLLGNVLIAAITAWGIILLTWCEANHFVLLVKYQTGVNQKKLIALTLLYAGFAFVISLIREVIKDMEDIDGDRRYGCKTMPIVWGINATKVFVAVWLIVIIAVATIAQFYVIQFGWWFSILYALTCIIAPLVWVFKQLFKASTSNDFHKLSTAVKMVMFTGIMSMFFFLIY